MAASYWALVEAGVVRETTDTDPEGRYPVEMAWHPCEASVAVGWQMPMPGVFVGPAPVVAPKRTKFAPLDFMDLMSADEKHAITAAALSNPALMLWLIECSSARSVDLADPRTRAGISALESAGLLTASRAADVLAGNPVPVAASPVSPLIAPVQQPAGNLAVTAPITQATVAASGSAA